MTNPRIARLEEQIHEIVARMLQSRIKDPRLGFVTITDVRLTGDSREATIFYTDFSSSQPSSVDSSKDTAAALESAKGLLRSTIGKKLGLRYTPTLTFIADASGQQAEEMDNLLDKVFLDDQLRANQRGKVFAGEADPYRKKSEDEL